MECLIIPSIIVVLGGIFILVYKIHGSDGWGIGIIAMAIFFLTAIIGCPVEYLQSRNKAWQAEEYYNNIAYPSMVQEASGYIVVDNAQAAVWQAGDFNIYGFNSYLRTTRYWDSVPLIGTCVYTPPEYLKYIRISP